MSKFAVNVLLSFLFILAFCTLAPNLATIDQPLTVLYVVGFIFISVIAYFLLLTVSAMLIPLGIGVVTTILLIICGIFFTPVSLYFADKYVGGFDIHSIWGYVLLSIGLYLFKIRSNDNKNETD